MSVWVENPETHLHLVRYLNILKVSWNKIEMSGNCHVDRELRISIHLTAECFKGVLFRANFGFLTRTEELKQGCLSYKLRKGLLKSVVLSIWQKIAFSEWGFVLIEDFFFRNWRIRDAKHSPLRWTLWTELGTRYLSNRFEISWTINEHEHETSRRESTPLSDWQKYTFQHIVFPFLTQTGVFQFCCASVRVKNPKLAWNPTPKTQSALGSIEIRIGLSVTSPAHFDSVVKR